MRGAVPPWAAFPSLLRSRGFRRALSAALLAAAGLTASHSALADDFDRLLAGAGAKGTVAALVTGWRAVTGDEVANQGSRGGGPVAITGDEFVRALEAASGKTAVTRRYDNFPVLALEMDAAALRAAKAHRSGVEIWEDPVLHPQLRESVRLVGAPRAWRAGYSGQGLAVAIIDDGADTRHPFLAERTVFEACFSDRCPNGAPRMIGPGAALPDDTHGTHVAGIVLGGAPEEDLAGVGPELRLVIINVANRTRDGMSGQNVLAGLDVVITLARRYPGVIGAVNMSLGAPREESGVCPSRIWDLASDLLIRAGVPVVVAAGNESEEDRAAPVGFPACIEGFISVGAVTKSEAVSSFSNSGPALDLLAPGEEIRSSVVDRSDGGPKHSFESLDGTSMAAPHVAAAMALLKQAAPGSSVADLLATLENTGREIRDPRSGVAADLIDIGRGIEALRPAAPAPSRPPVPYLTIEAEPEAGPDPAPEPELDPEPEPGPEPEPEEEEQWKSITG